MFSQLQAENKAVRTKYQSIYTLVTFKMVLLLYKLGNWFFSLVDDVNAMLISFGKDVNYALHMEPDSMFF